MKKSMLLDFWGHERDQAETLACGLKVLRGQQATGRPTVKMWMPRASKPYANLVFRDGARREAYIDEQERGYVAQQRMLAERRAARAGQLDGVELEPVKVGSIFDRSWGYDQTNVNFYEVTAIKGRMLTLRELAQRQSAGAAGPMAEYVLPIPGRYLDGERHQPLRKLLQYTAEGRAHLSFEFGWCDLWHGAPEYSSWSH